MNQPTSFRRIATMVGIAFVLIGAFYLGNKLLINVPADRIYMVQTPGGTMHVLSAPGWQNQSLGDLVGDYPKFELTSFDIPEDQRESMNYENAWTDNNTSRYGIKVKFYDQGEAFLFGTIPVEMPMDDSSLIAIQYKHGGWESLRAQIIHKQLVSAVTQVGAFMTSREASAERRGDLIGYIEDMVKNGIYLTRTRETYEVDAVTGDSVVVRFAERISDPNSPGGYRRQATSEVAKYNIRIGTPAINRVVFSPIVQGQLLKQQEMAMEIQTSRARALVAQQDEKTAASQGKTKIAEVQSKMNAEKEQAVIAAVQRKEVAEQDMKAAEFTKRQLILEGEGEAEKKKLLMAADGALNPKLDAFIKVQQAWASAWAANGANVVPTYMSGGGSASPSGVSNLIDMMTINNAKQLGLDLNMRGK